MNIISTSYVPYQLMSFTLIALTTSVASVLHAKWLRSDYEVTTKHYIHITYIILHCLV
jgi:hypothetical protein